MQDPRAPDPIDVAVGLRVRSLRTARGMSQAQLGAHLGITFQQVQKYERGTNRISASMLVKAAAALSTTAAALLPEESDSILHSPAALSVVAKVRGAGELVEGYAAIRSPRHRRAVLQLVRALRELPTDGGGQEDDG